MSAPTQLFFYGLYALPFIVAAFVLIRAKLLEWKAARDADVIERPILEEDDPLMDEVRSQPMPRRYISYSAPSF